MDQHNQSGRVSGFQTRDAVSDERKRRFKTRFKSGILKKRGFSNDAQNTAWRRRDSVIARMRSSRLMLAGLRDNFRIRKFFR